MDKIDQKVDKVEQNEPTILNIEPKDQIRRKIDQKMDKIDRNEFLMLDQMNK